METYKIVRNTFSGDHTTIKSGLTLDEAQEWCNDEDTHDMDAADPWFDSYTVDTSGSAYEAAGFHDAEDFLAYNAQHEWECEPFGPFR